MSLYGGSSVGWKLSSVWFTITKWHSIIYNNHFLFIITTCSWLGLEERWGQLGGESLGLGTRTLSETFFFTIEMCAFFARMIVMMVTLIPGSVVSGGVMRD